jgi:hypothetical protein
MKKYLLYLGFIVGLVLLIVLFFVKLSPTTLSKEESDFGTPNFEKIGKIKMTNEKGESLFLELKDNQWLVNGKYAINEDPQAQLFTTIQKMQTMAPVPESAQNNVVRDMLRTYHYCQLYEKGSDKPFKAFYVGGSTLDSRGTYMLMEMDGEVAKKPYIVYVPGFGGFLTGRFNEDELHWRSRWVARYKPEQIKEVKIVYNRTPENSFSVKREKDDSLALFNAAGERKEQPKQLFLEQYLSFLEGLSLESFENTNPIKDSILAQQPYCTVSITDTKGEKNVTTIYHMPINKRSMKQFDDGGKPLIYDLERYYATNKNDFLMIQYFVWGKALRSYDEFFRKRETKTNK